jgi:hypothetical protein
MMLSESSVEQIQKLRTAVRELIVADLDAKHVTSALIYHTSLSDPSPVSIKDKLSGLCRDQIIALARGLASKK